MCLYMNTCMYRTHTPERKNIHSSFPEPFPTPCLAQGLPQVNNLSSFSPFLDFLPSFWIAEIEPRALSRLGKCSAYYELHPQPFIIFKKTF